MSPTIDTVANVIDEIKAGEYISAIKMYREIKGVGLKEAKEAIDQLRLGIEIKVLKCHSIDEMRHKIDEMSIISGNRKEFLLDIIDEAFYLGEDNGHQTGYMKALEENDHRASDEDMMDEAYNNGYNEGTQEGFEDGQNQGFDEGREEGSEESYNEGFSEGREEGREEGIIEGLERGRAERTPM